MRGRAAKNLRALARFLPGAPRRFVQDQNTVEVKTPDGPKKVLRPGTVKLAPTEARRKYSLLKAEYLRNPSGARSIINAMGEQIRAVR
jgi:hypothetical protein